MIEILILIPVITAMTFLFMRTERAIFSISVIGSGALALTTLILCIHVFREGTLDEGIWYIDQLSAFFLAIIAMMSMMVAVYSIGYLGHERREGEAKVGDLRYYHLFLHLFIATMVIVCVVDSLGLMWIAIEATTLASAFLVGFYRKGEALEALWKYLIVCSVGIALALMGIILAYASSITVLGETSDALDWTRLFSIADQLDPALMKVAFIFLLVGLGTKVGLAPMHTWLPDAHSQAPTPVSAMLSAVLLNCAFYVILRFHLITEACVPGFSSSLLIAFGLVSMAVAAFFIVVARDIKRMLAYSSVEHMGIIALGFGIGGPLGVFGALFHLLSHSLTKGFMFMVSGNIVQKYGTREMDDIRGLHDTMPRSSTMMALGSLAITGAPPFAVFVGELSILYAAIATGRYMEAVMFMVFLLMIFAAFNWHIFSMIGGSSKEGVPKGELPPLRYVPMFVLLFIILFLGIFLPQQLKDAFDSIGDLFRMVMV